MALLTGFAWIDWFLKSTGGEGGLTLVVAWFHILTNKRHQPLSSGSAALIVLTALIPVHSSAERSSLIPNARARLRSSTHLLCE